MAVGLRGDLQMVDGGAGGAVWRQLELMSRSCGAGPKLGEILFQGWVLVVE